ncbi:hypothetical protein DFH09DRAFT_1074861 [Mycena vulgaris]|nr:hypothetical protein DFH09DRAFT_1074861 [Mycena vulgaris]
MRRAWADDWTPDGSGNTTVAAGQRLSRNESSACSARTRCTQVARGVLGELKVPRILNPLGRRASLYRPEASRGAPYGGATVGCDGVREAERTSEQVQLRAKGSVEGCTKRCGRRVREKRQSSHDYNEHGEDSAIIRASGQRDGSEWNGMTLGEGALGHLIRKDPEAALVVVEEKEGLERNNLWQKPPKKEQTSATAGDHSFLFPIHRNLGVMSLDIKLARSPVRTSSTVQSPNIYFSVSLVYWTSLKLRSASSATVLQLKWKSNGNRISGSSRFAFSGPPWLHAAGYFLKDNAATTENVGKFVSLILMWMGMNPRPVAIKSHTVASIDSITFDTTGW